MTGPGSGSRVGWVAIVAVVTTAATLALMQVESPAVGGGAAYRTPSWAVGAHLATVGPAIMLGPVILWRRKGDRSHRGLGSVWLALMVTTAVVSFWIRGVNGAVSGIHLFSIGTLIAVPVGIWRARAHDTRAHRQIMISLYIGLIVAGAFALEPDRIAGRVLSQSGST